MKRKNVTFAWYSNDNVSVTCLKLTLTSVFKKFSFKHVTGTLSLEYHVNVTFFLFHKFVTLVSLKVPSGTDFFSPPPSQIYETKNCKKDFVQLFAGKKKKNK